MKSFEVCFVLESQLPSAQEYCGMQDFAALPTAATTLSFLTDGLSFTEKVADIHSRASSQKLAGSRHSTSIGQDSPRRRAVQPTEHRCLPNTTFGSCCKTAYSSLLRQNACCLQAETTRDIAEPSCTGAEAPEAQVLGQNAAQHPLQKPSIP